MRRLLTTRPQPGPPWALTPLVDVVTILLIFLLKTYSQDPSVRPGDDFTLPVSRSEAGATAHLSVDVTMDAIEVAGERLASSRYYLERDDDLVEELYSLLLAMGEDGTLALRVDAAVPFRLVRKVVFTCGEAGVDRVTLVAASSGSL